MIYGVCGLPGGGKSYYLSCEIAEAVKKGRPVFTNYPFPGAYVLTFEDLIKKSYPEGSLLGIDEANTWFRNRDWAKMPKEAFMFFMHHRHFKLDMILVSQIPTTLDVSIRDIVSYWIWSSAIFAPFIRSKDGQPRALWFRYSYYLTVEELAAGRNCIKVERRRARQSIFRQFDSYYKFVELQREPINLRRWQDEVTGN